MLFIYIAKICKNGLNSFFRLKLLCWINFFFLNKTKLKCSFTFSPSYENKELNTWYVNQKSRELPGFLLSFIKLHSPLMMNNLHETTVLNYILKFCNGLKF